MLKAVLSKANQILIDARQRLSAEAADAIEKVCIKIENLNDYIDREMGRIERNATLGTDARSDARRQVLEAAGRKLEVLKDKSNFAALSEASCGNASAPDARNEQPVLQFMREREIRDRLFGMTEAQILSHFGASLFQGDNLLLLNAILNAPPGFEVLSEHNLRKLRKIRARKSPLQPAKRPEAVCNAGASIIEIFKLAKIELDRLRRKELAGSFPAKQPGPV
jgi:hypothetical protein